MRNASTLASLWLILLTTGTVAARQERGTDAIRPHATVNEIMIGIVDPNTNIVGTAAFIDPAAPPDDPFTESRGWVGVRSAAAAMAEAANLLRTPRSCSNGTPAPTDAVDWIEWTEEMRQAGLASYAAAERKSMEELLDLSEQLTASCVSCHGKYLDLATDTLASCAP